MKKIIAVLAAFFAISTLSGCVTGGFRELKLDAQGQYYVTPYPASIEFDGILDDEVWGQVYWQGNTHSRSLDLEEGDSDFIFAAVADQEYLYIAFHITDDVLHYGEDLGATNYGDDSVEFYLDPNNSAGTSYDEDDVQVRIGADWFDGPQEFLGSARAAKIGAEAIPVMTETGWDVEIRVPLMNDYWDIQPEEGLSIGFNAHYNDDDDGNGRDHKLIWSLNDSDDSSWSRSDSFGQLVFTVQ